jgi:hypothetical protein
VHLFKALSNWIQLAYYPLSINSHTHKWDDLRWLYDESVSKIFIKGIKVVDINIAIVLFKENIFTDLISEKELVYFFKRGRVDKPVNKSIIKSELEYKLLQLCLYVTATIIVLTSRTEHTERVDRLSIHFD